jgi:hypothetical protein
MFAFQRLRPNAAKKAGFASTNAANSSIVLQTRALVIAKSTPTTTTVSR